MSFHAVISAGVNEFGNDRHRVAPRVKASERVTGYGQQQRSDRMAGPVTKVTEPAIVEAQDAIKAMGLDIRRGFRFTEDMITVIERGTTWRDVVVKGRKTGNQEMRVSSGVLRLTKVTKTVKRVKFSAWVGTLTTWDGELHHLDAQLIVKGAAPVKDDVRSLTLTRAILGKI
jgi:hypothetical protein